MTNARKLCLTWGWQRLEKDLCCFSYAVWVGQDGADDCDGVGTRIDYTGGFCRSDPANSHEGKVTNSLPDCTQSFETKHRSGVALGRSREDRTDGEIVDREFRSLDGLFDVVG